MGGWKFPKPNWYLILPAAIAGAAGPLSCLPAPKPAVSPAMQALAKNPRSNAAFNTWLKPFMEEPAFKERLKAGRGQEQPMETAVVVMGGPAAVLAQQLAARGVVRLPPKEFMEVQRLKLELARKSPKVCAGMWSGGISELELIKTIERLPDPDLQRYFELSGQALKLELHAKEPLPRFERAVIIEGIQEIANALPSAEQQALLQTVGAGADVPPGAGCKAITQLLTGALQMPLERGARFMAGLSSPTLVDG